MPIPSRQGNRTNGEAAKNEGNASEAGGLGILGATSCRFLADGFWERRVACYDGHVDLNLCPNPRLMINIPPKETVLVRYGAIPEVARFRIATDDSLTRDDWVVVNTHRGVELGRLLQDVDDRYQRSHELEGADVVARILRLATPDDRKGHEESRKECESQFEAWCRRITDWKLNLELIDLEWTLDREKLVLYVLNERGPDCTKLALQAAAAGLGIIEVQPVDAGGLVQLETGGGCGTGGCGCH